MICNLTFGIFSMFPILTIEIKNGKALIPYRKVNQLFEWLDGPVRLVATPAGDLRDSSEKWFTQKEGIELFPSFISYPSRNPLYEVSPILTDQKIVMLSLAPETSIEPNNVLNFWNWKMLTSGWLMIIAILIFRFFLKMNLSQDNMFRSLSRIIWNAVKLFFQRIFANDDSGPLKILMLSAAIFISFFMTILSCYISTDLVVQKRSFTIDKLEDLLDPRAAEYFPLWRKSSGIHLIFAKSSSPTKQKIWKKAIKMGLDKCLVSDDHSNIALFSYSARPRVAFLLHMWARAAKPFHCGGMEMGSKKRIHMGKEIVGTELIGLPIRLRNDSCRTMKESFVKKRFSTMREANLVSEIFWDSTCKDIAKSFTSSEQDWRCLGHVDPFEKPDWLQITTLNTKWLFSFFFLSLALSLIILICEIAIHEFKFMLKK